MTSIFLPVAWQQCSCKLNHSKTEFNMYSTTHVNNIHTRVLFTGSSSTFFTSFIYFTFHTLKIVLYPPFEEVEIIELDGASQRVLWILQLLWVHVVCDWIKTNIQKMLTNLKETGLPLRHHITIHLHSYLSVRWTSPLTLGIGYWCSCLWGCWDSFWCVSAP